MAAPDAARRGRGERFYVPELDGLRFLAFFAVFVHHAIYTAPAPRARGLQWHQLEWWTSSAVLAGGFGVDLFFVLSSFLITSLLVREADRRGRIDVPAFWMRRALRIWPLYHGFVLLCWAFDGLPSRVALAFAAFVGNWAMLVWPAPERSLIGPLWSVSVEEQFYLAWPLLLALAPRRWVRPVCLGMIALALAWRAAILLNGGGVERVWLNTFSRLDPIAVGALVALSASRRRIELPARLRRALAIGAPLVVVAATGVLWHVLLRPSAEVGTPLVARAGSLPLLGVSLVFLVIAAAFGAVLVAALAAPGSWLGHPALVYLGRISYGLYVFHLVGIRPVEALWWPVRCVLSFAITVAVASVSYRLLEQPFLRLKERFTYIPSAPTGGPDRELAEAAAASRAGAVSK